MELIINRQRLLNKLRFADRIISKNISLPILNTVLLKGENNYLKILATNLELGVIFTIGAKVIEGGEIAVPGKVFSDFVSGVEDEKMSIKTAGNVVRLESQNYKTQILSMDSKDFPIMPKIKKEPATRILSHDLKKSLLNVLDSASVSEIRPELNGVFVNLTRNSAEFAATDSFRLSEKITQIASGMVKSFIVPRNAVVEIVRLMEDAEDEVFISNQENQLLIYGTDFEFISRLIDGRYPDYKKIIPERCISIFKLNRKELERNIRLASIFSSSIYDIRLKITDGKLEISAKNNDRGEISSNIKGQLKNKPFEVSVNYNYLLDGLKTITTDHATIEYTGEGNPLVIRGEEAKDQTYVIMPLRA